jgi:hypothetical protein
VLIPIPARVLKRQTVATEIHLGGEQIIQKLIYVSKKIMNEHTIVLRLNEFLLQLFDALILSLFLKQYHT